MLYRDTHFENYGLEAAQEEYDRQTPKEAEPVGQCSICGADIFEGEKICKIDGEMICSDCYVLTEAEKEESPDEY